MHISISHKVLQISWIFNEIFKYIRIHLTKFLGWWQLMPIWQPFLCPPLKVVMVNLYSTTTVSTVIFTAHCMHYSTLYALTSRCSCGYLCHEFGTLQKICGHVVMLFSGHTLLWVLLTFLEYELADSYIPPAHGLLAKVSGQSLSHLLRHGTRDYIGGLHVFWCSKLS